MGFITPAWVPKLPEIPDTLPLNDFIFEEEHGRAPIASSLDPYIDGVSGKSIGPLALKENVDCLARALARELDWGVNKGSEFSKVAGIFALNTIDVPAVNGAILRLNGVSTPANAAYNATELAHQLKTSKAQALFTVNPLLDVALAAAKAAGVRQSRVFLCELPQDDTNAYPNNIRTISQLIEQGKALHPLAQVKWNPGQGARQTAFLCYSSGTSGQPKGVMISHRNVIANVIQIATFESQMRVTFDGPNFRDVVLGILPQSHIYGLVVISHAATYRGDSVIILPSYDLETCLRSIQTHSIRTLFVVPPIINNMVQNQLLCQKYDLSSVKTIFSGAAPLGEETIKCLKQHSVPSDLWFGSSGNLLPGHVAKVMSPGGKEITTFDTPGELFVQGPTVALGYFMNEDATKETFVDHPDGRYMHTGDEVVFREAASGSQHIFIVDRLKELIKVNGHQVAPAELEACLLEHPEVADCAVISVPDDRAGEVPKAYIVKASSIATPEGELKTQLQTYITNRKARHKRLKGGIEFIDIIPKSDSGKILRRILRDKDRAERRQGSVTAKL
ncbi:uncharacterized protein A1O9_06893 [Exophiala aquamarina CBS 119918]|uniref:Phenylacetyl-CoA ligase n=1 Tax=Exophiala aquamarina CBS 119918 TaxID=1182545 RepID=A0A072P9B0_9EURO|nr:uncharacterized protein A1O9_06893 [Exophiala aquamarina CBS 119918]KEF56704.1 hypothetical protein A1O9_06893 [Exophiala aquamarina CBS 119918]